MRKIPLLFFFSIIVLASFGLFFQLTTEPMQFIFSLLKMLLVAALLFAIIYFLFFRSKQANDPSKKYKQAVKQSQKKYGKAHGQKVGINASHSYKRNPKRNTSHLRVIEGTKPKDDDNVSF